MIFLLKTTIPKPTMTSARPPQTVIMRLDPVRVRQASLTPGGLEEYIKEVGSDFGTVVSFTPGDDAITFHVVIEPSEDFLGEIGVVSVITEEDVIKGKAVSRFMAHEGAQDYTQAL